jgi:hypothetical protein
MIHRHDLIMNHDCNGRFSCNLLYVIYCNIYSFFDLFFGQFVLYFECSVTNSRGHYRGKEEKIDPEIFKRQNEWHMAS